MSRHFLQNWMPYSLKVCGDAENSTLADQCAYSGLDCSNRLFVSDRAQLVFDFHQIVDGLKEVELGGSRYEFLTRFIS